MEHRYIWSNYKSVWDVQNGEWNKYLNSNLCEKYVYKYIYMCVSV